MRSGSREGLLEEIRELARQREGRRVPDLVSITFEDRAQDRDWR